jgi:Protein of unknown function (DUF3168)
MTTLDESIQALLDPLATGGAFQDIATQGTIAPYIVWLNVVSSTNNTLSGATNVQNTRLQIDCYATSAAARKSLSDAVIAAMATASFKNLQITGQGSFEAETKLFRKIIEFSIWSV